jgi:hypothetical protein
MSAWYDTSGGASDMLLIDGQGAPKEQRFPTEGPLKVPFTTNAGRASHLSTIKSQSSDGHTAEKQKE